MTRPFDWQSRMSRALTARRETLFAWGGHDCALFACDIARVVCEIDFAEPLRGRYTTRLGAYKVLKDYGGGGLEETAEKIAKDHDCEEVTPLMARRGDIILAKILVYGEVLEDSLGVCIGERAAFAAAQGFVQVPMTQTRRAWRIP